MATAATQCTQSLYGATEGSKPSTRRKYSEKVVLIAPSDAARMSTSSDQPTRNAGSRPQPSRMNTYIPPVAGSSPDSSASVSAPHSANSPPATHTDISGSGPGSLAAMPAGERKIPEPIVDPTSTATALQRPSCRVSEVA